MIKTFQMISTLSMSRVVYSHCSSFLPTPTIIWTRSFCSVECLLVELSADIDYIYKDLTEDGLLLSISCSRLVFIQQRIVCGLYVLSPLEIQIIKKVDLTQYLSEKLSDLPDIQFWTCADPAFISVIIPSNKEDGLILMGLSRMLFRLSYGCLPKDGYRLSNLVSSFQESIKKMGIVDRVYKLDLSESLTKIPISLILDKVMPLVGEGSVYKLISSFLNLPIYDEDGNLRSDISSGMPPVGEISRQLFNIVLIDIFDREFRKRFPGIAFSRHINEVFISTRETDEVLFDKKAGYTLLEELSLAGQIESIGRGEGTLHCQYCRLSVSAKGKIKVK